MQFTLIFSILFDVLLVAMLSFLYFDLGVYIKAKLKKKSDFKEFIKSKQEGFKKNPNSDFVSLFIPLLFLVPYVMFHVLFVLKDFTIAKAIFGISLSFVAIIFPLLGFSTNPDNIRSITEPHVRIGKFCFSMSPRRGLKGSLINWNSLDFGIFFYNSLKKVMALVTYSVFILGIFLVLFGIFDGFFI